MSHPDVIDARCIICLTEWSIDYDPVACVCDDGGAWQLRTGEDGEWSEPTYRQ